MSANRLTVGQLLNNNTRIPQSLGLVENDLPGVLSYANPAEERLVNNAGQTGWFGTWSRVVFHVTPCHPYLTLPRIFNRVIQLSFCRSPVRVNGPFFELMEASVGLQMRCRGGPVDNLNNSVMFPNFCGEAAGFDRGNFPTMQDLDDENQQLVVYATDPRDIAAGRRILISQALDQNGNPIYTDDGGNQVDGFYITFANPFAVSTVNGAPIIVTHFGGIQKDATFGDILLFQQDVTTGVEILLSRYGPDEIAPSYRRYFLSNPPCHCFPLPSQSPCITPLPNSQVAHITAMVKMAYVPKNRATDFMIIQHIEALREEMMSIRYGAMDTPTADEKKRSHHADAVALLNHQLASELGKDQIDINYAPFGVARLARPLRAVRFG
jgi:hypothetical protein